MSRLATYLEILPTLPDWDAYLLANSGLPGPRGNLELAQAAAELGDETRFAPWRALGPVQAPANSRGEFLAFCGVLGLGQRLAAGDPAAAAELRPFASDPRWRTREAVAMALQRWGLVRLAALLGELASWAGGNLFEQRAVIAGLCEPAVLRLAREAPAEQEMIYDLIDSITAAFVQTAGQRSEGRLALQKALGYGWSVAVATLPEEGRPRLERWLPHPDLRPIMRENLSKARLERLDPTWTQFWRVKLQN